MQRKRLLGRAVAAASLALLLALGAAAPVGAEEAAPAAHPLRVRVSVYLMSVGKPDLTTGQFTADFYLVMKCDEACDPSGFEAKNGKITSLDEQDQTETMRVFRVNALLTAPLELHRYPFDTHRLTIELEDRLRPVSELLYVPDTQANGIDPAVDVPGWNLDRDAARATTDVHHYPVFEAPYDDFSTYRFEVEIGRAPLAGFMKVVFPALAIMATALLGLFLKPDKAVNRLGIHTVALTAAIVFHLNVTQSIPPTGYLVDADKFMVANYVGLVGAVLTTVLVMIRFDRGVEERAVAVYRLSLLAVPLAWLASLGVVWLTR